MTLTLVLGWLRRVPWRVYVIAALLSITALLRWHWIGVGEERCQRAQEAAETKADAKAAKVAKRASAKAQEASATIQKETSDAAAEVRVILRNRACPAAPERVHELGRAAVEAARRELPAGPPGDP